MKKNSVSIRKTSVLTQKNSLSRDKYFLRDLHQEIDLYDRKLAHLQNHAEFDTESEREEAKAKLISKRASLEKTARELAAHGVEFSDSDLPRSFGQSDLAQTRS